MMDPTLLAGVGILLGISLAGPPGPVTAVMVQRSLASAMRGFAVGLGAMTADFTLMIIILTLGRTLELARYDDYIYIVGSVFFLYLAYVILRSSSASPPDRVLASGYLTGLTIGLVNPLQIAWWLTAGLSILQTFGIITMAFLFVGIIIWTSFLSSLIRYASMKYEKQVLMGVKIFSVISLSIFGALFLVLAFTGITGIKIM